MLRILKILFFTSLFFVLSSCTNPFAPKLDYELGSGTSLISDQSTIEGIFQNLQYAYTFKDTTIYGNLLSEKFYIYFQRL